MASTQAHLKQYWHNRALISILPASHSDWIATVAFYCAVQLVDAVLANSNVHPVDHKSRNATLANVKNLELIAKKYDPLYTLARRVRYFADPATWVPFDQIDKQILKNYLYPLEHSAYKLLKLQNPHQLIPINGGPAAAPAAPAPAPSIPPAAGVDPASVATT